MVPLDAAECRRQAVDRDARACRLGPACRAGCRAAGSDCPSAPGALTAAAPADARASGAAAARAAPGRCADLPLADAGSGAPRGQSAAAGPDEGPARALPRQDAEVPAWLARQAVRVPLGSSTGSAAAGSGARATATSGSTAGGAVIAGGVSGAASTAGRLLANGRGLSLDVRLCRRRLWLRRRGRHSSAGSGAGLADLHQARRRKRRRGRLGRLGGPCRTSFPAQPPAYRRTTRWMEP